MWPHTSRSNANRPARPLGHPRRKVRIYRLDTPEGRRLLGLDRPGDRITDALFWYRDRRTLVAVELKGADIDSGLKQLRGTVNALQSRLRERNCRDIPIRAVLVYLGGSHPNQEKRIQRFRAETGVRLDLKSRRVLIDELLDAR